MRKENEMVAVKIILGIALYWFAGWFYVKKFYQSSTNHLPIEYTYSEELSARIQRIYSINQQIQSIEELITDVQLAENDRQKNIGLTWNTTAGKNLSADIWVDGESEVSSQMLELAEKRKQELISSLFSEIYQLPVRSQQNVSKTLEYQGRGEDMNHV
jgi:hypothetical protein